MKWTIENTEETCMYRCKWRSFVTDLQSIYGWFEGGENVVVKKRKEKKSKASQQNFPVEGPRGLFRLFFFFSFLGLWSSVCANVYRLFSGMALTSALKNWSGSCNLINGSLRIKAIRKAFVEVLQLFCPPTSPPTTLEHQSLHTPTWVSSTGEGRIIEITQQQSLHGLKLTQESICHFQSFWFRVTFTHGQHYYLFITHSLKKTLYFCHSSAASCSVAGKYDAALSGDNDKRLKLQEKVTSDGPALHCVLSSFSFKRDAVKAQLGFVSSSIRASSCIAATSGLNLVLKQIQ